MAPYTHPISPAGGISEVARPRSYPGDLAPSEALARAAGGTYAISEARRRRAACCYTCGHRVETDLFTSRHSCTRYGGEIKPWWTCDSHRPLEA